MSIEQFIENELRSNDIVLFMKGTPQFPVRIFESCGPDSRIRRSPLQDAQCV
jgi:glutaredoxin-related protein